LACYSWGVVAGDLNAIVVQTGESVNRQTARPEVPKEPEPPFQTGAPLLQVRDLRTNILKPASLALAAGECIAVWGPSGAGKTLLLRAIADLDPNHGLVSLEGRDRSTIPGPEWRRLVGYVPAEPGWWAETVGEHFGDWTAASAVLTNLGFPEEAKSWSIARLSTGERLRLALVRALILRPKVLLLDEPTSALDAASVAAVESLIVTRMRAGLAVLWVTHDADQASRIGRRRLVVEAGRVREEIDQIGLVLTALFSPVSPLWTGLAVLAMILFAGQEVMQRQDRQLSGWWSFGLGTGCMMMSSVLVTTFALLTALRPIPWYDPRYAIRCSG